ncbi:hypothetical protein GH5_05653 [Leishmania sp. Ghana 2012 LV757]|uniref:hypothetical protein n=1 Tax=Leishmania sp. Ghana 2012 LV757 TaxID=2803181 RepID=UPI001B63112B|nr:hypothetical protein GH5_05653 [Leishmania sp. Ghana 2012 LV757]
MSAPYSSLSPSSSPSVAKKRVIASPRTAHDLTMRLGHEGLSGSHCGMVSPLTELLACSPSQLQPLSSDVALSPSSWTSRGSGGAGPLPNSTREQARVPAAREVTSVASSRHTHQSSSLGRSSPSDVPLRREGGSLAFDGAADAPSGERSAFLTVPCVSSGKGAPHPRRGLPTLFGAVSTPLASSQACRSSSMTTALNKDSPRDGGVLMQHTTDPLASEVAGEKTPVEYNASPIGRTRHEGRRGTTGSFGSAGSGHVSALASASASAGATGTASRTLDTYGLPNALLVGGGSSSGTPSHSRSAAMASPHGRAAFAASILTMGSQLATGNAHGGGGGSAGVSANFNGTCAFTPMSRPLDGTGRQSRAPRLTSHLFLEDGFVSDSVLPPAGLQSPAVPNGKRRCGCSGSSDHLSVAALDQSRTPRCSAEGQASFCDDSHTLTTLSVSADVWRPTVANFVKGELIGKGSYGAVYRGMQRSNNRIIAMKEIRLPRVVEQQLLQPEQLAVTAISPAGAASSPVMLVSSALEESAFVKEVEAIKRELTLLKQLSHPNIVRYLNDEVVDGTLRIYMEYVSGGSVTAALKSYGSFEEPQAAAICYQLLQGLAYMHRRGIIHRDLKGDNLLLETSSQLKIADLGTAKSIISSATATANIVGTAYFMAPEVLQPNGAAAGTAADIWSVACCVIEMLTGRPPLADLPNQFSVMMAIGGSATVSLSKYIPADNKWSGEVLDFISQCLRANPADRPAAVDLLQHSWFSKMLNVTHVPSVVSTPVTLTSFLTPTAPPIERPLNSAPQRHVVSPICSPDSTAALTPGYTGPQFSAGHPGSRNSSRASSHTSRERKWKREKRTSRRQRRYLTSGAASATSHHSQGSSQVSTPQNSSSTRTRDGSAQSGSLTRAHSQPGGQHVSNTRRRNHVLSLGHGLLKEDSQQSSSSEYVMHHRTCTYGSSGGGGDSSGDYKSKGTFLPAIHPNGSAAPSPCGYSLDALRGSRSLKNSGSSREPTKAYLYPPDMESMGRDSMHLGQSLSDHQHSLSRDFVDSSVPYSSVTKVGVEGGSKARGAGSCSVVGDLEGTGQRPLPTNVSGRRYESCKSPHRGNGEL